MCSSPGSVERRPLAVDRGRRARELSRVTCPITEIARLGRTLRQWKHTYLGYFTTDRSSNGGTEAIGIIELHRRIARGYRNRDNYRLLLAASGTRPWRANHA